MTTSVSMFTRLRSACAAALLAWAAGAPAQTVAPDALVRSTSEEVLKVVTEDKELRNGNTAKLIDIIETRVVPHFDIAKMTRLVVGKAWRQATADQQKQLVAEFQKLLVRSYGAAYSAYRQVKVDVKPLKLNGDESDVIVKTQILLPGGAPPVAVDYAMNPSPSGWKVYNVVVEGVSLVTTYRNDFGAQIEQGGIDALIHSLQERNTKAAQPPGPKK